MSKKRTPEHSGISDVPYDSQDSKATDAFWSDATQHKGLAELRAKRGRPKLADDAKKQQISLRVDTDVLEWYRELGEGWQTKMNAVLRAYKESSR